jgi:ribonuclease-3
LGAIFLDGGYGAVRESVRRLFAGRWPEGGGRAKNKDNKSRLQEVTQQFFKERPQYSLVDSSGPEHDKLFTVRLELPDKTVFTATGASVKKAEQTAAQAALQHFSGNGEYGGDGRMPSL